VARLPRGQDTNSIPPHQGGKKKAAKEAKQAAKDRNYAGQSDQGEILANVKPLKSKLRKSLKNNTKSRVTKNPPKRLTRCSRRS